MNPRPVGYNTDNGKQSVAPIVIDGCEKNQVVIDSNALYANKKEAITLLQNHGHQLSVHLIPHDGFYHSICESNSPVNSKFPNATEPQQFKRWFADWQNSQKEASKIVNADGTPKVMYHGSQAQFTIFEKKMAKASGLYPD